MKLRTSTPISILKDSLSAVRVGAGLKQNYLHITTALNRVPSIIDSRAKKAKVRYTDGPKKKVVLKYKLIKLCWKTFLQAVQYTLSGIL